MIRHPWTTRHASGQGFTLLEVLMAAIIISLGVLGLTALFAGAAREQQVASEMTRSVIATKNAEAMIARTFGQLDSSDPTQLQQCFRADRWYPVPMDDRDHYLKIDNACAGVPSDDLGSPIFFLVRPNEPTPVTVYELVTGYRTAIGLHNYNALPSPFNDIQARRVDPFSISEIRVYTKLNPESTDPFAIGDRVLRYTLPSFVTIDDPMDWWLQGGGGTDTWRYVRNGDDTRVFTDYVEMNLRLTGDNTGPLATISNLQIDDGPNSGDRYIDRIEVVDYRWRNDQLVSLNNRLVWVPDVTSPDGRRPSVGYSVLFRRQESSNQMALVTYALSPRTGGSTYVPPERQRDINANIGPLQTIRVSIFYDDAVDAHYVRVPEADAWAVAPGQILFIQARVDPDGTSGPESAQIAGADFGIRVTRRQQDGTFYRGYLERAPRAIGTAMLPDRNGSVSGTAWAVAERIESIDDGSEWLLRPLEVRLFQLQ